MSLPHRIPVSSAQPVTTPKLANQGRSFRRNFKATSNPWIDRRAERSWLDHLPDFAMQLSRSMRSGIPIEQALVDAAAGASVPARVQMVAARVGAGQPLGTSIENWSGAARSEPERLLVTALKVGLMAGAQMGPVLDGLAMTLRDELALDARRRVLLVQAQASAVVLVVMPLGFVVLVSIMRGGFAFNGVVGLVLLTVGLTLDGLGVFWMRRLLRGLQ